jgi:hypothetical protein
LSFFPFRCIAFFALTAICTLLPAADSGSLSKRSGLSPILRHAAPTADSQSKLPAGLNLVDWKQIRAEYERHRHGMFPDGQGGFQSRSHYHGWLARFDGKGFTVKPDTQAWSWGLELVSWGREAHPVAVSGKAQIHRDVNRLEYRRQGITEWFVNGKEGLEHGFTIQQRPDGGEEELRLQLRQRGELVAVQDAGGRAVSYKTKQGAPALRYRKLLVTDARGRRLPARMVADGEWLRILVNDRRAVYPIVVDPLTQQAYLKASNTDASDNFGSSIVNGSVAISGDTVVVGAYTEDSNATGVNGTQSDNSASQAGAAYVLAVGPEVTALSPSSGPLAGGQSVTITGADFTGATAVTIGGATVPSFTVVSSTSITATTPAGSAGTASVLVTTPSGTSSSNTLYTYQAAPTVTAISSSSGPLAGGQSVTITGTDFTGATAVTIGGAAATGVTVVSATSITATTPAGTAGTASVLVTTPGGTNSANTLYTYLVGAVTLWGAASGTASAAGETGKTVTVTANASWYTWTATSNAAWLTITAGASTTGSGSVTYNVAAYANSITSRTGTLTIGGQTFTVTQSGVTGAVTLSPTSYTAPFTGAVGRSITVTSNATDFAWTATANVPWLTITGGVSGTGNGTVTYNVAANGGNERVGTLTVGGKTFVVSQGEKPEIVLPQTRIEASFATGEKVTPLMVDVGGAPGFGITVRSLVPWLEVTPNLLTLPGKLTITPGAQLKPGNYLGIIVLQAEGVDPVFVYVRLTVTEPPQFIALPAAMQLEGSSTGVLYITSRGRQVRYEAEALSEAGWLSVTPENGMTPVNLRVTANTYFLKPGVHTGTVRVITREPGGGGPVTIPVTVRVPEKAQ